MNTHHLSVPLSGLILMVLMSILVFSTAPYMGSSVFGLGLAVYTGIMQVVAVSTDAGVAFRDAVATVGFAIGTLLAALVWGVLYVVLQIGARRILYGVITEGRFFFHLVYTYTLNTLFVTVFGTVYGLMQVNASLSVSGLYGGGRDTLLIGCAGFALIVTTWLQHRVNRFVCGSCSTIVPRISRG